jgi:hypothetical protein
VKPPCCARERGEWTVLSLTCVACATRLESASDLCVCVHVSLGGGLCI